MSRSEEQDIDHRVGAHMLRPTPSHDQDKVVVCGDPIIPLSAISAVQSNLRYSKRIVSVATSYMFLSAKRKRAAKVDGSTIAESRHPLPIDYSGKISNYLIAATVRL